MKLSPCARCSSFLPPGASTCPECGTAAVRPMPRVLRGAMALGAGTLLSMTLSACYGAPPEGPEPMFPDAGRDAGTDSGLVIDAGEALDSGAGEDGGAVDDGGAGDGGAADDGGADDAGT